METPEQIDERTTFQQNVDEWMQACFGAEISADTTERNHRFLEEALELVQSLDCTASEAHQLVDYVFGREIGEPAQETGGVMVTLAALCSAAGLDMRHAGFMELARVWTKIEKIRAKQAAKPKHSPLPQAVSDASAGLVAVPVEDLAEVLVGVEHFVSAHGASPHFNGCVERLQDAIRAAQGEHVDG